MNNKTTLFLKKDDSEISLTRVANNLGEMLELMEVALRGHGFNFKGYLTIEEEEEEADKREEQTDSVEGAVYELKLEIENFQREDLIKPNNIVEDLLQKKLCRFADKAQNLLNALEDENRISDSY